MTSTDAASLVKKHGSVTAAASASGIPRTTFRRLLNKPVAAGPEAQTLPGGISLKGVRMLDKKPADSVKRLIYTLKRGMGYPLDMLSEKWGISPDTIRSHARRFEALKYVETAPGQWVPCVLHPDTAAEAERN